MKIQNLRKHNFLDRILSIKSANEFTLLPGEESVSGTFGYDKNHKTIYVGGDVIREDGLARIIPAEIPIVKSPYVCFVEVNPEILKYGVVYYSKILTVGDKFECYFRPHGKSTELNLSWIFKYKVAEGVK